MDDNQREEGIKKDFYVYLHATVSYYQQHLTVA